MPTSIYIPHILVNLTGDDIVRIFHDKGVGKVTYADIHYKQNGSSQRYCFAFVGIEFYNNPLTKYICDSIRGQGTFQFTYNFQHNQYWELRRHVAQIDRIGKPFNGENTKGNGSYSLENVKVCKKPRQRNPNIAYDDRDCLAKEYEQLEREIFKICCV